MQNTQKKTYKPVVLLLSGGIDSTTALYNLKKQGKEIHCLTFDYGQTLKKEINVAKVNAKKVGAMWQCVNIDLGFARSKCSLISKTHISTGRTAREIKLGTPSSYVEFRNGILLAYAVMYCEANDIHEISGGFNGLASGNYYDDTLQFIRSFEATANIGTSPGFEVRIKAPYSRCSKAQIVREGIRLGVPYCKTWSCYKNGKRHCGVCDSCIQRVKALIKGGYSEEV